MRYSAIVLLLVLTCCTSNPVSDDQIAGTGVTISGRVELSHNASPEGAHIWLESFNIWTRTDASGIFSLTLPAGRGELNGSFRLFAYVCNYDLGTREIAISNGALLPGQPGLAADGGLEQAIRLSRQLSIRIESRALRLSGQDSIFFLSAKVFLQAGRPSVDVYFPVSSNETHGPLFLRNVKTRKTSLISSTVTGFSEDSLSVDERVQTRQMVAFLPYSNFPAGDYEVVPYLLVKDPRVPANLLSSIIADAQALSADYLELPFVRVGGMVAVPAAENAPLGQLISDPP